jgi:hypothetical protein
VFSTYTDTTINPHDDLATSRGERGTMLVPASSHFHSTLGITISS